jgi:hypothetical protein
MILLAVFSSSSRTTVRFILGFAVQGGQRKKRALLWGTFSRQ